MVQDYPFDFFRSVQELKAGIIIPKPKLQRRLLEVITSPAYARLHNPRYSAVANPFSIRYQNCTEHTLDVLHAAIYKTENLRQIKANTRAYFKPQRITIGPMQMLMGSLFSPGIAFSDHPDAVETATFTTIGKYMVKYELAAKQFTVVLDER